MRKKRSLFSFLLLGLNFIVAIALLLSYLAAYLNPFSFTPIAILGLVYPILLGLNVAFLVYWVIRWRRAAWLSVAVILVGWTAIGGTIQLLPGSSTPAGTDPIEVLSYNVRLFDLYNWSNNKETRNQIFDQLKEEDPDILCFQEYFHSTDPEYFLTTDTLVDLLTANNHHFEYTRKVVEKHFFGIATYSRYPIIHKGRLDFGDSSTNLCIYTDLKIGSDTLRVYNMHLASLHFGKQNYQFMENIGEAKNEEAIRGIKAIYKLIRVAFEKRKAQAEQVAQHIANSPYPVLVCGDFNDTPHSFAYKQISQGLTDAFRESGWGLGTSYNGKIPLLRIDYILHGPEWESSDFRTLSTSHSDHHPLSVTLHRTAN